MHRNFIERKSEKLHVLNFLMLTVAGIVNACGVTLFLYPVKLYSAV